MTFGDKLVNLRKQNNMTQDESAEKLGVTRQTVSNWELNQTKPDLDQLKGLSKLYKISLDELTDNDVKEVLSEKVSNVEKLAGLIYKILKIMLFVFVGIIVLTILAVVLFSVVRSSESSVEVFEETVTLNCTLNEEKYVIDVKSGKNNKIIEVGGSSKLINILDLEKCSYSDQVIDKVTSYIENNGGSCE